MKRYAIVFLNLLLMSCLVLMFCVSVFAQGATIIDVKGKVTLKRDATKAWEKAKRGMELGPNAELKTAKKSECVIAFDKALKNVMTIRQNSSLKLEKVLPVSVSLPQGKVFALIENLESIEDFRIKTPTAIAGVRGTGESVRSGNDGTQVLCFEGGILVQGLDNRGNPTGERDLSGGLGVSIGLDGNLGDTFEVPRSDLAQWSDVRGNIEGARRGIEGNAGGAQDTPGDLMQERRDTIQDESLEQLRRQEDKGSDDQGQTGYGT